MNEYLIILIFILWYTFSMIVSESVGSKKKLGVQWSFFFCMMFSPVLGYLITYFGSDSLATSK
ncbi:MAG: hypothetical protein A2W85_13000 [Bacteroidetes bacterium GWF2_41_31]|nr:MAG: hypothetical protein A2W85_13000 [Bacteroidetes bacterium GWF2_41_31]